MLINKLDNVEVNIEDGHKYAISDIRMGENIIKYGYPIGHATCDIKKGDHVHSHNMKTNLSDKLEYNYEPDFTPIESKKSDLTFKGYIRENGDVGIRNDIWIVNTVGCVNKVSKKLAEITGAISFEHPFGCSQLGDDHKTTQLILKGLVNHPNAGGVLVLGLGCENNNIEEKNILGEKVAYYIIKMPGEVKVMVPTAKAEEIGVRNIIDADTAGKVFNVLETDSTEMALNWNKRYRDNMDKMKSGDVYEIADVVRNLSFKQKERGLSTGEKKMLLNAKQILVSELTLAGNMQKEAIEEMVETRLDKSYEIYNGKQGEAGITPVQKLIEY